MGGGKEAKRRRQLVREGLSATKAATKAAEEFADVRKRQAEIEGTAGAVNKSEREREREKRKRENKKQTSIDMGEPAAEADCETPKKKHNKATKDDAATVETVAELKRKKNEEQLAALDETEALDVRKRKKKKHEQSALVDETEALGVPIEKAKQLGSLEFIVFVGQLPFDADAECVEQHFAKAGIEHMSVRMLTEKGTNKSRGMAFVQLSCEEDVTIALGLHQSELSGRWINVERSGKKRKAVVDGAIDKQPGLTNSFSGEQAKIDKQLSVFVAKLPFSANPDLIRRYFEENGVKRVEAVKMLSEKGTNKKGMAFVRLADEDGVQAALALHESQFDRRWIVVERSSKTQAKHRAEEETQVELHAAA